MSKTQLLRQIAKVENRLLYTRKSLQETLEREKAAERELELLWANYRELFGEISKGTPEPKKN